MDAEIDTMDGLATGVTEVDVEHQLQLQLVDAIRTAVLAHRDRATVSSLLLQLEDASNVHFLSEELLMRLHSWHRYEQHTEEHRRLLDELRVLRRDFERGAGAEMVVALEQLRAWLVSHVRGMDRAFAQEVARARPARATP
jgi:hemerythrin